MTDKLKMFSIILKTTKQLALFPIKNILKRLHDFLTWDSWFKRSWAQEGEDILLRRIFGMKNSGFYVDVGAHHPKRFSNTYFFYLMGWSGINIDAMPGSMVLFNKCRKRDINLELGVGKQEGHLDFFVFNEPALNSFSYELSEERHASDNDCHIVNVVSVKVESLSRILDRYLVGQKIDFLSVDVEGFDLDVLKSNDWLKFRPEFILVEILQSSLNDIEQEPISKFMREQGYILYAKLVNTVFFKDVGLEY